ncbi:MAG: hypothetical protein RL701_5843, partial [Pseudomonadota bacterium]
MAALVLQVPDINEAGKDFAFELGSASFDPVLQDAGLRLDPAQAPGRVDVHVQLNGDEYLVTGRVRAHLLTECGRCLGDAHVPVDVQLAALFTQQARASKPSKPGKEPKAAARKPHRAPEIIEIDDSTEEDDLQHETFVGNDIVLDGLVREHLVLEVPMQPLCSEACEGIAVPKHLQPPADTFAPVSAVDPRLAPLQRLRDNVPAKTSGDEPTPAELNEPV